MLTSSTSKPGPGRFNKACDSCHVSKVRCMPDPQSPTGRTCKRCSKNAAPCVFSPVGPRRRPVRTKNDRIAELERRVRDMQLKLERQVEKRAAAAAAAAIDDDGEKEEEEEDDDDDEKADAPPPPLPPDPSRNPDNPASPSRTPGVEADTAPRSLSGWSLHAEDHDPKSVARSVPPRTERLDIIERGLLTASQADRLIHEFRSHLDGKFLGMCLPDGATSTRLRRDKPAFWLSVLCAASTGSGSPEFLSLAPVLFGEMKRLLDGRITSGAAPDLDALQALMNYCTFHYDPALPLGEHLMGLWSAAIRMVVQMAEASPLGHALPQPGEDSDDFDDNDVQLARELLHWYWAGFSLTVKNRQSIMLRQTHLVEASLRVLQTTQSHHDMCLVEWVRLVRIAAEAVLALHRGHTEETAGLSDEARDAILDEFEKKRKRWLVECPFYFVNEPLMLEYHYYVLLVSEVIYPAGPADFRRRSHGLPSLSLSPKNSTPLPDQHFFAPYKLRYTRKCITAAHACLDLATRGSPSNAGARSGSYHSTDTCSTEDLLRRFGVLPYGRIFYALRFLLFVAHEVWRTGRYDVVDIETLRIEAYLTALKRCLRATSSGGKYRISSLWLYALETRIEPWYQRLYALLQRDRPRREDPAGEETPRPSSRQAVSPNRGKTASQSQDRDSTTVNDTLAEVPLSPLLLEFPFELFSSSDMFAAPPSNSIPQFDWRLSTNPISFNASALGNEARLTTTRSTQTSSEPLREPQTRPSYLEHHLETISGDAHLGPNNSPNGNLGDLDSWFGDLNMDLDPFTCTLDYLNEVLPGCDVFSSIPSHDVPPRAAQQLKSGGLRGDGGGSATAQSGG